MKIVKKLLMALFGVPWHGSKIDRLRVPWHGSKIDRLRGSLAWITSHHITSHHIRSDHITLHPSMAPERNVNKNARKGSGIDEIQHNLVKTARNFDASPAVTTGMRQDGKTKEGGHSQKKEGGKASGWAPEITPKHRKSLPNITKWKTTRRRLRRRPPGGLVVFHLVRISDVLA